MINKTVECPKCKTHVEIQGNPGEVTKISCPNCKTTGKFSFPGEISKIGTNNSYNTIEVKNLTKNFNGFKALDNVSLNVRKGEITGFVGPNGAGKTTTIKILTNLLTPTSGHAYINNIDVSKTPTKALLSVGSLIEVPGVYDYLTPHEMLKYYAKVHRMNKNEIDKIDDLTMRYIDEIDGYNEYRIRTEAQDRNKSKRMKLITGITISLSLVVAILLIKVSD